MDYTPTTEEVRRAFRRGILPRTPRLLPAFDRWLAEVKAQAWDEAFDAGHDYAIGHAPKDNPYRQEEKE